MITEEKWPPDDVGALDEFKDKLLSIGQTRHYDSGVLLHQVGEPVEVASVIQSGRVQITRRNPKGVARVTLTLGERGMYGLAALLSGRIRSHNAETVEPSVICHVSRKQIWQLVDESPDIRRGIIAFLTKRLFQAYDALEDELELPLAKKLGKRLLEYADAKGAITSTQTQLADEFGASRNGIGNALKQMQELELIEVGYKVIKITDSAGIRKWAVP